MNDTTTLGSGNSLYHKFKSIGFTKIDSFTRNVPFFFFYKKGSNSFTPIQSVGLGPLHSPQTSLQVPHPTEGDNITYFPVPHVHSVPTKVSPSSHLVQSLAKGPEHSLQIPLQVWQVYVSSLYSLTEHSQDPSTKVPEAQLKHDCAVKSEHVPQEGSQEVHLKAASSKYCEEVQLV
ncbi:MAG: hypothetical protein EOP49_49140 [Sphingobacteriales bacterium]|nr:MAG: hypothetical protein EOP49_49140 [Sphingobacteriales bacterium]